MTRLKEKQKRVCTEIIKTSIERGVQTKDDFLRLKRDMAGRERAAIPSTAVLRSAYFDCLRDRPDLRSKTLEKILTRREVRSLSGVAIVTVLTKPYPCPGKCVYCPTEANMPKSYLANEPAAMRALANKFDPWRQVETRLRALVENGHAADKIELIVKGGTWTAYPWQYRQWFVKRCFDAANAFGNGRRRRTASLIEAQTQNERAGYRIVGLTLETRPDWITAEEISRLRALGCTRVELGVQSVNDRVLEAARRGHGVAAVVRAARLLKNAGFKTDFHLMPQLPGATPDSDLDDLREIFRNPDYRPDMIKIYPCVVIESTELYDRWRQKKYVPYPNKKLIEMLIAAKTAVPRYCRLSRLIRDIPSTSIRAGNAITNLREIVQQKMKERGIVCHCLRCREIGRQGKARPELLAASPIFFDDPYAASAGEEHFLSFEDAKRQAVFAFCRLRLPPKRPDADTEKLMALMPEINGAAFIRELHTYGHLVPIAGRDPSAAQHKGLGRALMARAEDLARAAGYEKMAVISGIGVREYYRKLGYRRQGTYMMKSL